MANPNLKVVRRRLSGAAGAPSDMEAGQIAINSVDEKVYIHNGTSAIPVAGKGEFVDKGSEQTVTGKKNFTAITVSTTPADANDAVRKTDLDTEVTALQGAITTEAGTREAADTALGLRIDALGNAFNYVGTVNGGANSGAAYNLASLTQKDAGDYYKVGTAGHFVLAPAASFFANSGDGLVFNLANGIDKLDNTDSTVAGTANEISVTGSTDTGYTVAIDAVFSGRVTALETTASNLGTMSTQDADAVAITGGTINGTAIGGTTAAAGAFTTLTASSTATLNTLASSGATLTGGSINGMAIGGTTAAAGAFTTLSASSTATLNTLASSGATLTGGSIDNMVIGATTAVAGSFTAVSASTISASGNVTFNGNIVGDGSTEITDCIIDAGTF
jgi:hypothetical protein